jgi:DNA mismatch repair protein MutL
VQRPASVVKELMENAIDAGATQIDLVVKDAGKTLIQVMDNGSGISENDLHLAFERHATSKISTADDIYNLHTKGFRGEALASIAAIAHVELKTKQADKELGYCATVEGSIVKSVEPVVCNNGSSFAVKNLFFNVPARRNFLKSDAVEGKHVLEEFLRLALTHENIGFSYTHNGNEIHRLPATDNLRKRIVSIFGKSFNDKLVPLEELTDIVGVKGFVLKPEFSKKTAGEQYFFVNNRFFKDRYFHHAVKTAFDNLIQKDHQVSYFIYFDINPSMIDVNVHPTKTEIKFEEDRAIYSILRSTVRQALGKFNITPTLDFEQETAFEYRPLGKDEEVRAPTITVNPNFNPFDPSTFKKPATSGGGGGGLKNANIKPNRDEWEQLYQVLEEKDEEQNSNVNNFFGDEESDTPNTNPRLILQVQQRYALSPSKTGFFLIDLKRAHLRILYNQFLAQFMHEPLSSQQLLFPVEREISVSETAFLEEQSKNITRLGFQWRVENDMVFIAGAPAQLGAEDVLSYFDDILNTFLLRDVDVGEIAHEMILALAKSAGFKGNRNLSQTELNHLVQDLFSCADHAFDPSGHKILKIVDLKDLTNDF